MGEKLHARETFKSEHSTTSINPLFIMLPRSPMYPRVMKTCQRQSETHLYFTMVILIYRRQ